MTKLLEHPPPLSLSTVRRHRRQPFNPRPASPSRRRYNYGRVPSRLRLHGPFVRPSFRRRLFQRTLDHAAAIDGCCRQGQLFSDRRRSSVIVTITVTPKFNSLDISSHCQRLSWFQNPLCSSQCMKHTVDESYLNPNKPLSICIKRQSMTRQLIVLEVLTIDYPSQKL